MTNPAMDELIAIGAGKIGPSLIDSVILQLAPTRTMLSVGWVGQHGILVSDSSQAPRRLAGIGVQARGWASVDSALDRVNCAAQLVSAGYDGFHAGAASWALEANDCLWFPIIKWDLLPASMVLSEYDVGHRVVITRGELMGATGQVIGVTDSSSIDVLPSSVKVRMANGHDTIATPEAVAVLLDDEPISLAPLRYLHPPGSSVWVQVRQRAGLPLTWRRATALHVENGHLNVLMSDGTVGVVPNRDEVALGELPQPPDGPVARTVRGARPVPRLKPRAMKVPPAKR